MASKKQRDRDRRAVRRLPVRRGSESRVTEFLTVAWMLSVLTALMCELAAAAALAYVRHRPEAVRMAVLSSVLLFAALVIGILSLVLMAVVWRMRKQKPPPGVCVFALVVGLLPALAIALQRFL